MKTPKVLLVEDNPRISKQLCALLSSMGLDVCTATNGMEAILTFNRELPHVIIMEQFLPLLSGEEVASRIRASLALSQLPILMLVSSRFGGLSPERRSGINLILEKPLQVHTFQQAVRQVLQYSQSRIPLKPLERYQTPEHFYALWGELSDVSLPALLFELREKKQTGVLLLTLPQGQRQIILREGELYYAESFVPEEQFHVFLKRRLGDNGALGQIDRTIVGSGARAVLQREAIIRASVLSELEVNPLYRQYQENIVIRSLFLMQGSFQLIEDFAYVDKACIGSPISLLPILLEGVQHSYSFTKLQSLFVPHYDKWFVVSPQYSLHVPALMQKFPSISFAPQRLSNRPVSQVIEDFSSNPQLNVQLLQALLLARLISLTSSPPTSSPDVRGSRLQPSMGHSAPSPSIPSQSLFRTAKQTQNPMQTQQNPPLFSHKKTERPTQQPWSSLPHTSENRYQSSLPPSIANAGIAPKKQQHPVDSPPLDSPPFSNRHTAHTVHTEPSVPSRVQGSVPSTGAAFSASRSILSQTPMHSGSQAQKGTVYPSTPLPKSPGTKLTLDKPAPRRRKSISEESIRVFPANEKNQQKEKGHFPSSDPEFVRVLDADFLRVQSEDYFRILDVSLDADADEIRSVYRRFFKIYNKDRFSREPEPSVRIKAGEVLRRISQACAVLSTPHARTAHEQKSKEKKQKIQNKLVYAQEQFRQGEYFFKNKNFRDAIPHFQNAIEANEKDPAFYLRLGWALFSTAFKDTNKILLAQTYIERALQMNPIFEDAYFYLGMIRKEQGELEAAAALLQRILLLNPGHEEAHRMLQQLEKKA